MCSDLCEAASLVSTLQLSQPSAVVSDDIFGEVLFLRIKYQSKITELCTFVLPALGLFSVPRSAGICSAAALWCVKLFLLDTSQVR